MFLVIARRLSLVVSAARALERRTAVGTDGYGLYLSRVLSRAAGNVPVGLWVGCILYNASCNHRAL